jgi:hypothetical protein
VALCAGNSRPCLASQYEQNDFSVGEISPDHVWRADLQVRNRSLKSGRNLRLLVGGPAQSRPGTTRLAQTANGDGQVIDVSIAGTVYMLVFTGTHLEVWNKLTRTLVTSFTGQAWSSAQAPLLTVSPEGAKTFVFCGTNDMQPQVIERSTAGVWSVTPYAFSSGIGSATSQPYHRFAAPGVTLTPSATTGAITLTASAAYFSASHVGLRLRLQGREVTVTVFTDTTHVTATVVQQLFPTKTVPVTSSVGYELGEIVEGKDSTAKGEVTAIPDGTHITVLMQTFTDFYWSGTAGEVIIGRNATATSTAAPSVTTDAAVLDWTEQAMSAFRGWPGTGVVHRGRLFMARFAQIPFGIVASAVGDFYDCEVGANDDDAIFEEFGDEGTGIVQHIVSAEQLIVLTSRQSTLLPGERVEPDQAERLPAAPHRPRRRVRLPAGADQRGRAVRRGRRRLDPRLLPHRRRPPVLAHSRPLAAGATPGQDAPHHGLRQRLTRRSTALRLRGEHRRHAGGGQLFGDRERRRAGLDAMGYAGGDPLAGRRPG